MFHTKLLALVGGALALALTAAQPANALSSSESTAAASRSITAPGETGDRSETAVTVGSGMTNGVISASPQRGRRPQAPRAAATPEEIRAAAQLLLTAAGSTCQVTAATQPGITLEQQKIYEAACAEGPGYILIEATPPQVFDCLELAGTAYTARLRDPAADVGQQCVLPANQNGLAVIGGWARTAGVTCTIDEAVAIGKNSEDNVVYEVGCAGADGYWLERAGTAWELRDCTEVTSTGSVCRFTTSQEQADSFEPKLAGTDASDCDVARVRLMGANANGRFYEAKCAAEGVGYIARINNEGVTQQIYPCATAQRIGGGCTLTPAPAAAPAPAPATTE